MTSTYGNFADPAGLLRRMILSGKRPAYDALAFAALQIAVAPLDLACASREARRLDRATAPDRPIILIVGLPRSGTTVIYQALAAALDVTYFSNFSALFPRAPLTAATLFGATPRRRAARLDSFYGNTSGLRGANDGFHVWNRWLGADRYDIAHDLSAEAVADMRRFFGAWTSAFGKPFLNKNNRNSLGVDILARALPTSVFVVVERTPLFVAQSLLEARRRIQGADDIGWGLGAHEDSVRTAPDLFHSVARQVVTTRRALSDHLSRIEADRVHHIGYEAFCAAPRKGITDVVDWLAHRSPGAVAMRPDAEDGLPDQLPAGNSPRLPPEAFARLQQALHTAEGR